MISTDPVEKRSMTDANLSVVRYGGWISTFTSNSLLSLKMTLALSKISCLKPSMSRRTTSTLEAAMCSSSSRCPTDFACTSITLVVSTCSFLSAASLLGVKRFEYEEPYSSSSVSLVAIAASMTVILCSYRFNNTYSRRSSTFNGTG